MFLSQNLKIKKIYNINSPDQIESFDTNIIHFCGLKSMFGVLFILMHLLSILSFHKKSKSIIIQLISHHNFFFEIQVEKT